MTFSIQSTGFSPVCVAFQEVSALGKGRGSPPTPHPRERQIGKASFLFNDNSQTPRTFCTMGSTQRHSPQTDFNYGAAGLCPGEARRWDQGFLSTRQIQKREYPRGGGGGETPSNYHHQEQLPPGWSRALGFTNRRFLLCPEALEEESRG